jgi:hypothetical protein
VRDLEWDVVDRDESECGFTLAAMPLASNMIANAIKSARRNGQNFTFTKPIPVVAQPKNRVTYLIMKQDARQMLHGRPTLVQLSDSRGFRRFSATRK